MVERYSELAPRVTPAKKSPAILEEAQKSSMLSDENSEVSAIERDIQGIYEEIQEYLLPKGFCMDEHLSKDICISKLLNSAKEDYMKDFEQEYHLTEGIVMNFRKYMTYKKDYNELLLLLLRTLVKDVLHFEEIMSGSTTRLTHIEVRVDDLKNKAYYLKVQYPVEKAPTEKLTTLGNGVSIIQLVQYPVSGLVFEGGACLEDLSDVVSKACIFLQDNNRPFNVLISESGKRIFLLPQCYAEKQALGKASEEFLDMRINPAVWELSGHLVLKRRKDYDGASEANICRFLVEASLSETEFRELKSCIMEFLASAVPTS
ncbi:hypothetical protein ABZP36_014275 [Zizania latifolia]